MSREPSAWSKVSLAKETNPGSAWIRRDNWFRVCVLELLKNTTFHIRHWLNGEIVTGRRGARGVDALLEACRRAYGRGVEYFSALRKPIPDVKVSKNNKHSKETYLKVRIVFKDHARCAKRTRGGYRSARGSRFGVIAVVFWAGRGHHQPGNPANENMWKFNLNNF